MTVGALITENLHPFGRAGAANTTGAIYGTTVSSVGSTSFIAVETVTVTLPSNAMISELQYVLTAGLSISATTDSPKIKYLITDMGGASYDTTASFTSTTLAALASSSALSDFTCSRTQTPSDGTNFTGKGSFDVICQVAANATTSNARGAVKQSSYLQYSYYLIG